MSQSSQDHEEKRSLSSRFLENKYVILGISIALVAIAIALISLSSAASANEKIAKEANSRALALQGIQDQQRRALCGFFETIGYPPAAAGMPATPYGQAFQAQGVYAAGPQGFNCTPDPTDKR